MARNFNGTSDYLTNTGTPPVTAVPFTLACWAYGDSDAADRRTLLALDTNTGTVLAALLVDWASVGNPLELLWQADPGNFEQTISTSGVSTGTWFHAAGVFASTTSRTVYLNGGNSATGTTSLTGTPDRMSIASRIYSGARGRYFPGSIAEVGVWNVALTAAEVAALADGAGPLLVRPDALVGYWPLFGRTSPEVSIVSAYAMTVSGATQIAHPPMRYPGRAQVWKYAAAGGATVNQATETDAAQAISRRKSLALGQAAETDSAQAITRVQSVALSQSSETDIAQSMSAHKLASVGQSSEIDLAQTIASLKALGFAQASETDLAQAMTVSTAREFGQATEQDTAQAIAGAKALSFGQCAETDLAQSVTALKALAIGQSTETDLAHPIAAPGEQIIPLSQAAETDAAQSMAWAMTRLLGQVAEADLAQLIASAKVKAIGQASETDAALAMTWALRRLVGQAAETDFALSITRLEPEAIFRLGGELVRVGYRPSLWRIGARPSVWRIGRRNR